MQKANLRGPCRRSLVSVALVVALVAPSCIAATVKRIVVESNAAMLAGCKLEAAEGADPGDCWKASAARIDEFIAANPDQPATNNSLRLRQALLLTVHRQDALAKAAFDSVEEKQLKTERDKALYALNDHLVWWYDRAPPPEDGSSAQAFNKAERVKVDIAVGAIDGKLEDLDGFANSELRWFLGTMRASMIARKSNDTTTVGGDGKPNPVNVTAVVQDMELAMQHFASLFTDSDVAWITARAIADDSGKSLLFLRRRVEAREIIRRYKSIAGRKNLSMAWTTDSSWKPTWIKNVR